MSIVRTGTGTEFTGELGELTFIVNAFSKAATGKTDDLSMKTIRSSDLTVVLRVSVNVYAILAKGVEKVVGWYKSLSELKKIKDEMTKHGVLPRGLPGSRGRLPEPMRSRVALLKAPSAFGR